MVFFTIYSIRGAFAVLTVCGESYRREEKLLVLAAYSTNLTNYLAYFALTAPQSARKLTEYEEEFEKKL